MYDETISKTEFHYVGLKDFLDKKGTPRSHPFHVHRAVSSTFESKTATILDFPLDQGSQSYK